MRSGMQATRWEQGWRSKRLTPSALLEWDNEVFVSLGQDRDGRQAVLEEAVRSGLITPARAAALLPQSESYWENWAKVAEGKQLAIDKSPENSLASGCGSSHPEGPSEGCRVNPQRIPAGSWPTPLADEQEEQNVRLAEHLRVATADKLDKHQSARDSQVISDVAAKTKALHDDVQRFGAERDDAIALSITAAVDQLAATLREEQRIHRREITEEIAVAVRSNFEALEAMICEVKK